MFSLCEMKRTYSDKWNIEAVYNFAFVALQTYCTINCTFLFVPQVKSFRPFLFVVALIKTYAAHEKNLV